MKRFLAWTAVFIIIAAFFALIFFTVTGASANVIMAAVFSMTIFPVMIYAIIQFTEAFKKQKDQEKND